MIRSLQVAVPASFVLARRMHIMSSGSAAACKPPL
jgi:ABC-type enterobactin transport system permease subunit